MRLGVLAFALLLAGAPPAQALSFGGIKAFVEWLQSGSKVRGLERAKELQNESAVLRQAGDTDAAIVKLEAAVALLREDGSPGSLKEAARVEQEVAALHAWRDVARAWRKADEAMRRGDDPAGESQAAARGEDLSRLTPERAQVVKALREAQPRARRVFWVSAQVRQFAQDFAAGVRDPATHLAAARRSHEALVARWLATPHAKRIFVVGAGADAERIRAAATRLEGRGYTVFFYDFCPRMTGTLCTSQSVGAFFSTAGHAVLVDTALASASHYVAVEAALARHAMGEGTRVLVLSPADVAVLALRGGTVWALMVEMDNRQPRKSRTITP